MPHTVLFLMLVLQGAPGEQRRIREIGESLMAPCCFAENVQRHSSEAAAAMRAEIGQMVAAGRTDRQIRDHYVGRYGRRVLHEPEGATWWILTAVPAATVGAALLAGVWILRRWRLQSRVA